MASHTRTCRMPTERGYALLEQQLNMAFAHAANRSLRGYWCDGILGPEGESGYLPAHVATTKQIRLRTWIDEGATRGRVTNQALYQIILPLGPRSLSAYLQQNSLDNFLADNTVDTGVTLKPGSKQIDSAIAVMAPFYRTKLLR